MCLNSQENTKRSSFGDPRHLKQGRGTFRRVWPATLVHGMATDQGSMTPKYTPNLGVVLLST